MEQNYRIYNLEGELLEVIDELSNCHFGKPGKTKEHAIQKGTSCYFRMIPGCPKNIRVCKEVHERFADEGDKVWILLFTDILGHDNVVVVKDEQNIRKHVENLVKSNRVESEDKIKVFLRTIW